LSLLLLLLLLSPKPSSNSSKVKPDVGAGSFGLLAVASRSSVKRES